MIGICKICNKEFNQLQERTRTRCNACNTSVRRYRNKLKALKLLGGKCVKCGYDKHPAALEFHHTDPSIKKFIIGGIWNKAWRSIEQEVIKCEILCSNCHRIKHSSIYDNILIGRVAEMD